MSTEVTTSQRLKCMKVSNYIIQRRLDEGPGIFQGMTSDERPHPFSRGIKGENTLMTVKNFLHQNHWG